MRARVDFGVLTDEETMEIAHEALMNLSEDNLIEVIKKSVIPSSREEVIAQLEALGENKLD